MILDVKVKKIKPDRKLKFVLKAKGVKRLYVFMNRQGDTVSGTYTKDDLISHKSKSVSQFIKSYNTLIYDKIEEYEINLVKLLRNKYRFKSLESYLVKLRKITKIINEQICKEISFLAEINL